MVGDAPLKAAPYGIAVPKGKQQLRDALKAALERTIKNGSYAKVLDKWGVEDGAVKKVEAQRRHPEPPTPSRPLESATPVEC